MRHCTRYVGLDESKDLIQVAVAEGGSRHEVREYGTIPNTPEALRKLVRNLGPAKDLHYAYEAGPTGYGTYRELRALGALHGGGSIQDAEAQRRQDQQRPAGRREPGPSSSRR